MRIEFPCLCGSRKGKERTSGLQNAKKGQTQELLDYIQSAFHRQFGGCCLAVKQMPVIHECWVSVKVTQKCPGMDEFARQLESEFQELGLVIHIRVVQQR